MSTYANCQLGGTDTQTRPDICLTPAPPAPSPVPTPYPNVAAGPTAVGFCPKVLLLGAPAHTVSTTIPMTNGDNAGVNLGQMSGTVMASSRHTTASAKVKWCGLPASRVTSKTKQNTVNTDGTRVAPGQTKVLILS